jgi:hypothetical protein
MNLAAKFVKTNTWRKHLCDKRVKRKPIQTYLIYVDLIAILFVTSKNSRLRLDDLTNSGAAVRERAHTGQDRELEKRRDNRRDNNASQEVGLGKGALLTNRGGPALEYFAAHLGSSATKERNRDSPRRTKGLDPRARTGKIRRP